MTERSAGHGDSGPGVAAAAADRAAADRAAADRAAADRAANDRAAAERENSRARAGAAAQGPAAQGAAVPGPAEPSAPETAGEADPRVPQPSAGDDAPPGLPGLLGSLGRRIRSGLAAATSDSATASAGSAAPAVPRPAAPARGTSPTGTGPPGAAPPVAARPAPSDHVPRLLQVTAAWAWRLILVAILIYGAFRISMTLRLVVLPIIASLLFTALLQPVAARLHRAGAPHLMATWCTLLGAIIIIAGAVTLTANRASADYPTLVAEVKRTAAQVQNSLAGPPFHLHGARLQQLGSSVVSYISQHKGVIAGTVVTGGKIFLEFLTGLILTLFISFFLLKDGAKIYSWLISGMSPEPQRRMVNAGHAAWHALTGYIRGTTAVAAIHAIFIGLALWLLGVPLLVPLIILVFLAAFVPLIGILVVGALAIVVTLGTKGWLAAVILLAVFLLENQIESHLLQPLVVGRAVRLHPLAIILALAVGGVIAGIPGAIVAVPVAAVITYAWPMLRGASPPADDSKPASPPDG